MVRLLRRLLLVAAWTCAVVGGAFVLFHTLPEMQSASSELAMASAFIPYGLPFWLVAVVGLAVGHRGWAKSFAVLALVALVVQVLWTRPYWPHAAPANTAPTVRVMAANVLYGRAKPASLADAIRSADADVVILLEVSERLLAAPEVSDALARFPHRVGSAAPAGVRDAAPTLVLSRTPLTEVSALPSWFDQYVVRVDVGGTPLTLVAAHPQNMMHGGHLWEREGRVLADGVRPHLAEPLAVVGDFNATPEQLTLRGLFDLGLDLGAQEAGAGWQPTFDGGLDGLPAMIAIDHVLTNGRVTTTAYRTIPVAGSDHRAIVADLAVR